MREGGTQEVLGGGRIGMVSGQAGSSFRKTDISRKMLYANLRGSSAGKSHLPTPPAGGCFGEQGVFGYCPSRAEWPAGVNAPPALR